MAAFMSTVATRLNWGSSYLVEDFYRRFLKKDANESHYVNVSRVATAFLVLAAAGVAWELKSVSEGWKIVLELGAGTAGEYLVSLLLGCVLIYSALFCIGEWCFGGYQEGFFLAIVAMICGLAISRLMPKSAEWRTN